MCPYLRLLNLRYYRASEIETEKLCQADRLVKGGQRDGNNFGGVFGWDLAKPIGRLRQSWQKMNAAGKVANCIVEQGVLWILLEVAIPGRGVAWLAC